MQERPEPNAISPPRIGRLSVAFYTMFDGGIEFHPDRMCSKNGGLIMKVTDLNGRVQLLHSSNSITAFVRDLTSKMEICSDPERRAATRQAIAIPVKAMPFDGLKRPVKPSFQALTRDISTNGISILCLERTNVEHLLLEFSLPDHDKVQIVMEVRRCRQLGPFWEIAGPFVDEQTVC